MPVLDPNPQNGQKKLLLVLGAMLLITVIIAVIASFASPDAAPDAFLRRLGPRRRLPDGTPRAFRHGADGGASTTIP